MTSFHYYLPITEELFHDGFYVTGAGRSQIAPNTHYPSQAHPAFYQFTWTQGRIFPEFAIILITAGQGTFQSKEGGTRAVKTGDVILLFPGIWHRYRPDPRTGWTEKWIQFNGEFPHKLWERHILSSHRQIISPDNFQKIETTLDSLLDRIEQRPGFNSLHYALQVSHLIDLVIDSKPSPVSMIRAVTPLAKDELVTAAENYIWTHSQLAISVRDVADHLKVSRRTLERRFGATLNRTVLEEVTRCRFNRAERLLRETDLPVKTVVYMAGFGRAENMRQAFAKQTQISPRAYRAKVRIDC
jgi:AraC-like DNA-binding protein